MRSIAVGKSTVKKTTVKKTTVKNTTVKNTTVTQNRSPIIFTPPPSYHARLQAARRSNHSLNARLKVATRKIEKLAALNEILKERNLDQRRNHMSALAAVQLQHSALEDAARSTGNHVSAIAMKLANAELANKSLRAAAEKADAHSTRLLEQLNVC